MRILVLSNKCPPDYDGGYELSAFQVASTLRGRGHDVRLLTSKYRETYKGARQDPDWVARSFRYLEWPSIAGSGIKRAWADADRVARMTSIGVENAETLRRFLDDNPVDLAYCFGLHGIGLATASPLAEKGIPILWHAGNYLIAQDMQLMPLLKRERLAHRIAMHFMARQAMGLIRSGDYSHIAFLSEAMRKEFVRMGFEPQHSYIIPRGIDFPLADPESTQKSGPPVLLMASRVAEEKGYSVVVEALSKIKSLPWELHIAGGGRPEYLASLKERSRHFGIENRVKFLGMLGREEVLNSMRNATLFISASLWEEPFGRTNIEALACGAPLVAADTGAIREIVGDSDCALIYPKQDAGALAASLETVLTSEDMRRRMSRLGIERIKSAYTMERILDLTEDVLEKVMKSYGKPFERPSRAAV